MTSGAGKARRDRLGLVTNKKLVQSIWLGVLIGLVAGGGAILFARSIELATQHLLDPIAGYTPAQPIGEGSPVSIGPSRRWALPGALGLGGLVSGMLVFWLAPEAEGHGTDAAIAAYHRKSGRTRFRVVPVKLVASAITIGSGGAAGREGPTAQIGSGFGSWLADLLKLGTSDRRRMLSAGMGAGIGAIFRAPLGGAMMGAEVLYKHDFEAENLLLGLISSIVSYSVYGTWAGWDPIFGNTQSFSFSHPGELFYYAVLGVVCGVVGLAYARGFYGTVRAFRRIPIPRFLKPALGGVIAGCIGIVAPQAIHVGYGTVQQLMSRDGVGQFSPWLLLALPVLRIATTSLTVGSGGSGGIFGPGMVIGGVTGALMWHFGHGLPGFPTEPGPVVIICMIAAFGSIAHVPLAMLLMVGEMTGNLSLLGPAMIALAIATLLVGEESIYENQVGTRVDSPAHRHRFTFPLLSALPAERATTPVVRIAPEATALQAEQQMTAGQARFGVIAGVARGEKVLLDLVKLKASAHDARARDIAEPVTVAVSPETPLDEAFDVLASERLSWLPVIEAGGGEIVGGLDARTLIRAYRDAARVRLRPLLSPLHDRLDFFELAVDKDSALANHAVRELDLAPNVLLVAVGREGRLLVPDGHTVLLAGDVVTFVTGDKSRSALLASLFAVRPANSSSFDGV